MKYFHRLLAALAITISVAPAHAKKPLSGWELFFSAGGGEANYYDSPLAFGRAGVGLRFFEHLSVGVSTQFDRLEYFGFGYAALHLRTHKTFGFYGRGEYGRQNGVSDPNAVGYAVGVTMGDRHIYRLYAEFNQILDPGYVDAVHIGLILNNRF